VVAICVEKKIPSAPALITFRTKSAVTSAIRSSPAWNSSGSSRM
jgi:hypothetical protein